MIQIFITNRIVNHLLLFVKPTNTLVSFRQHMHFQRRADNIVNEIARLTDDFIYLICRVVL